MSRPVESTKHAALNGKFNALEALERSGSTDTTLHLDDFSPKPKMTSQPTSITFNTISSDQTDESLMGAVQKRISELDEARFYLTMSESTSAQQDAPAASCSLTILGGVCSSLVALICCLVMLLLFEQLKPFENDAFSDARAQEFQGILIEIHRLAYIFSAVLVLTFAIVGCLLGRRLSKSLKLTLDMTTFFGKCESRRDILQKWSSKSYIRIQEVIDLQTALVSNWTSIETFSRYLPDTVVERIMQGDSRARRLHVSRRNVSIMFSDIKNFTTIAESLAAQDLLFLLTRYLSTMTRIVSTYHGVVAEILGDGLLVFWNSIDDLPDHQANACNAALAQQYALNALNDEFLAFNFPHLAIRIGLHSGKVLCGNIGSEAKMKFGCMGDPVNLASRLEGLCKYYGVGVLCSQALREEARKQGMFCFRELDLVRVKGKNASTRVFELMGLAPVVPETKETDGQASSTAKRFMRQASRLAVQESAVAMKTFNGLEFNPLKGVGDIDFLMSKSEADDSAIATASLDDMNRKELYESALSHFQAGRFMGAQQNLNQLLEKYCDDQAAQILLERTSQLLEQPFLVTQSWTGVNVMVDK